MQPLRLMEQEMDIRQIEYFHKVCEYRTLSASARELYVSEQALSKSIATLERELGFDLFIRTSRGLELTDAGRIMSEKAFDAVSTIREFQNTASNILDGIGKQRIVLGFYEGFLGGESDPFPAGILAEFQKTHPNILLGIFEGANEQISHRINKGLLDLGVFIGETSSDLSSVMLERLTLGLVVSRSNPLSKKKILEWKDLDGQKIIHLRGKHSMHDDVVRICERHHAKPDLAHIFASALISLQFVYRNEGILILDRRYENVIEKDKAVFLQLPSNASIMHPPVSIAWSSNLELTQNHKKLISLIKSNFPA